MRRCLLLNALLIECFIAVLLLTGSVDIEVDALRERQRRRVVDRVGRAAHVGLPRIRTRLTSTAGFLLATERAADFRAARSDVHVSDTTIAARVGQEAFSFAQIGRE